MRPCETQKSDIIYCGLTGYGDDGPLKDKAGYDQVLQCVTGICRFIWAETKATTLDATCEPAELWGIHPTKEGDVYLSAKHASLLAGACELTSLSGLGDDPTYHTVRNRAQRGDGILPKLRTSLLAHTGLEWEEHYPYRSLIRIRTVQNIP